MKKHLGAWFGTAMLTLFAVVTFAAPAFAAWKFEDVRWRHYSSNPGSGTGVGSFVADTLWIPALASRADTTAPWTMADCDVVPLTTYGANTADSIACAYIVVASDSTVASSVNFKNTTVTVQVNYGDRNGGWQTFATAYSPLATDGQKAIFVPLFQRLAAITTDLGIDYSVPFAIMAPQMRAIVTWGSSAAVPSARVRVKKFITSQTITKQGSDL